MNKVFFVLSFFYFIVLCSSVVLADFVAINNNVIQLQNDIKKNNNIVNNADTVNVLNNSSNANITANYKKNTNVNNNTNSNLENLKNVDTKNIVNDNALSKSVNANINLIDIKNDVAVSDLQSNNTNATNNGLKSIDNSLTNTLGHTSNSFVNNNSNVRVEANNLDTKDYIGNVNAPLSWNGKSFGSDNSEDSSNNNDISDKVISNISRPPIFSNDSVEPKHNTSEYSIRSDLPQSASKDVKNINNFNTPLHDKSNEIAINTSKNVNQNKDKAIEVIKHDLIKSDTKETNQKFNIFDLKKSYEDIPEIKEIDNHVDWGDYITIKNKKIIPEPIKEEVSPLVYKKSYSVENAHMPIAIYESDYQMMLFDAIKQHDSLAVSYLIDIVGVDIKMNDTGDTPLTFAVKYGDEQSLKTILLKGCSIIEKNSNGENALDIAKRLDKKSFENIIVSMIVD